MNESYRQPEKITYAEENVSRLPNETIEQIRKIVENPENFIDEGGVGKVYRLPSGICIKILEARHESKNADKFDLGNTVEVEARFLEDLSSFSAHGVRSPHYLGYVKGHTEKGLTAILMEELDAVNLQHILNKTQPVPETFHYERFMEALERYIDELHTQKEIIHGDLEPRNIMVDRKTGMPFVIDFGRSKRTYHMSESEKKKMVDTEWQNLDETALKLEDFVSH